VLRFGFWLAVGVVAVTLAMLALFRAMERKEPVLLDSGDKSRTKS